MTFNRHHCFRAHREYTVLCIFLYSPLEPERQPCLSQKHELHEVGLDFNFIRIFFPFSQRTGKTHPFKDDSGSGVPPSPISLCVFPGKDLKFPPSHIKKAHFVNGGVKAGEKQALDPLSVFRVSSCEIEKKKASFSIKSWNKLGRTVEIWRLPPDLAKRSPLFTILPLDLRSKGEPKCVLRALESRRMRPALYTEMFSYFCLWKQNRKWSRQGRKCWNIVRQESQRDVAIQGGGRTRA